MCSSDLRNLSTSGITLLIDVPRVADGLKVFDRMVDTGRSLANALGGTLVDDKRAPLGDASLAAIRGQLARVYAAMEARGIVAGSDTARRLFS